MTDEKTDAYVAQVTGAIVAAIEAGDADPDLWVAPWHHVDPRDLAPTNPVTGAPFTGGNRLGLFMIGQMIGAPGYWATFKQWQSIGAQVRKGETARARALRPMQRTFEDKDTGDKVTRTIGFGSYVVFHAGQVDGWDMPARPDVAVHTDDAARDIDAAYTWAATIGARVIESPTSGASYSPTLDHVTVPDRARWHDSHGAWSTIAHELTHWTGHESRLSRTFGKRFGDNAYAIEELCAELGAAFTLARRGRSTEPRPDHAHYLAHWLRVLKARPDALFTAAAKAEVAATYIADRAIEVGQVAA